MTKRIISLVMVLVMLSAMLGAFPASAADEDGSGVRYTQKIVTVVYDNSTSMKEEAERYPAAKYSLSLLMSLLDERDQMRIVPMNLCPAGGIPVDLSVSDREAELERIFAENERVLSPIGSTPSNSLHNAVSILSDDDLGMKDNEHLIESDPDKEYWLVILTDGLFDNDSEPSAQAKKIIDAIGNYPTLHTVYVSFGSSAMDISSRPELKKYPFLDTYCQVPVTSNDDNNLVAVMQQIANKITGRYPLGSAQYTVDGSTVTIDLSKIPFSISSLSVIAQNCGATVQTVKYDNPALEGNNPKVSLDKICTVRPDAELGIKEGCSFKTVSEKYLSGGTLVYEFSGPVSVDELSIFAEPALDITTYLEATVDGTSKRVDAQFINENLGKGDKIRVGYEVLDQISGEVMDLEKVFGSVNTKVVYNQKEFAIGEDIPLEVGSYDLSIEITVMDGAFTLRRSELITVEEDPSFFRIEVQGNDTVSGSDPKATAVFTVFIDNAPATKELLDTYDCNMIARSSNGSVIFDKKVEPGSDGKISAELKLETNKFDVYSFELTVKSPELLSRTKDYSVTYAPSTLDITLKGASHMTLTQSQLKSNAEGFVFELSTNGQPFPFDNGLTEYKLSAGTTDLTGSVKVENNLLTFIPTADSLGALAENPGDIELSLTLSSQSYPGLATSASAKLTIEKTVYSVVPVDGGNKSIDRFKLKSCDAALFFSIQKDDVPFTEEELKAALDSGKVDIKKTPLFNFFLFPAGTTTTVETVNGTPVIAVRGVKDMARYLEWHFSAFITGGDKPVTVTYADATGSDSFTVVKSNILWHILKIFCLVLAIAIYTYLIIYIIGFFVAKPLPRGVFIKIQSNGFWNPYYVNEKPIKYILWHLTRFDPRKIWAKQTTAGQIPSCNGLEFSHGNNRTINLTPKKTAQDCIYPIECGPKPNVIAIMEEFHAAIANGQKYDIKNALSKINAKVDGDFCTIPFGETPLEPQSNAAMSTEVYYGFYNTNKFTKKQTLSYAIFFKTL